MAKKAKVIGFVKKGKSYFLVSGSKTKPKLSKRRFNTKASMMKFLRKG